MRGGSGPLVCKQGSIPSLLFELNRDSTSLCLPLPLWNGHLPTLNTSLNSSHIHPFFFPRYLTIEYRGGVLTPFSSRLLFVPCLICSIFYPIRNLYVHSLFYSLFLSPPLLPSSFSSPFSFFYFWSVRLCDSSFPYMDVHIFLISFTFRSSLHVFN